MAEITRNRTIRPSSQKQTGSEKYSINIRRVQTGDTLVVNITHEKKPFRKTCTFRGSEVLKKKSLGFKVREEGNKIFIDWVSTQPVNG